MARPYPRTVSKTWWLKRWPYRIFMLRELSAVFVAAYVVLLLVLVTKVHDGASAFEGYLDTLQSPGLIGFHVVALLFVMLHAITWFQGGAQRAPDPPRRGASAASSDHRCQLRWLAGGERCGCRHLPALSAEGLLCADQTNRSSGRCSPLAAWWRRCWCRS